MLLEPTALATALRYLAESLEQDYGVDPLPLFAKAGLPREPMHQSGARVSQRAVRRLWELGIAATGDPACGLNVGRRIKPEGLHALGYAWMSSGSLVEAFNRFCRYTEVLVTLPLTRSLQREAGGYRLTFVFPDPAHQPHEAGIDATLLALVSLAGQALWVFGCSIPAVPSPPGTPPPSVRRQLRCPGRRPADRHGDG